MEHLPSIESLLSSLCSQDPAIRHYAKHSLGDRFITEDRILETILAYSKPSNLEELWSEACLVLDQPISARGAELLLPLLDKTLRTKNKMNSFYSRFILQVPDGVLQAWSSLLPKWKYLGQQEKEYVEFKSNLLATETNDLWTSFVNLSFEAEDAYLGESVVNKLEILSDILIRRNDLDVELLYEVLPPLMPKKLELGEGGYAELFALKIGTLRKVENIRKLVIPYYIEGHSGDYSDLAIKFTATGSVLSGLVRQRFGQNLS